MIEEFLRRHVEFMAGARSAAARARPYNSFYEFFLRHGSKMECLNPRPAIARGLQLPAQCFRNAAILALEEPQEYTYCEGYAFTGTFFPVHHAWTVNRDGLVVDPTWETGHYFGVRVKESYLREAFYRGVFYGVLDRMDLTFPVLSGKIKAGLILDNPPLRSKSRHAPI